MAAAAGVALGLCTSTSFARFEQAGCNMFGFDPPIPVNLGAQEFTKKSTDPAAGPTDMTLYNVNTRSAWSLHVNTNVVALKPYFGFFDTEKGPDHLDVQELSSPFHTYVYTGILNPFTNAITPAADLWFPNEPGSQFPGELLVSWTSDLSVANFAPPSFAAIAATCSGTQSPAITHVAHINPNERHDGLLLDTHDVLYFQVDVPANRPVILTLDTTTPDVDFDLYANTGQALPDDNHFEFRGFSNLASEALRIPASPSARTFNIGVHSYRGAGHFVLHAYVHNDYPDNKVCVKNSTLGAADIDKLKAFLTTGSTTLFGFTNGNLFRSHFTIVQNVGSCGTDCDVCVFDDNGSTSQGTPAYFVWDPDCGYIDAHGANWRSGASMGWLFAHESGHSCFDLSDEYKKPPAGPVTPRYCGHSTMANNAKATGFCSIAHCEDGQLSGSCDADSNWRTLYDNGTFPFSGMDFDFFGETADPTPIWNNPNLNALVTFN
ncbi:hypothetical protein A7982_13330 [Minicystis rosea]|nr:hypothetical protein A7982_13330 [Minicystis rosea]